MTLSGTNFYDRLWSSRANGHLKLLPTYPTLGLMSNQDALKQPVVTANYAESVFRLECPYVELYITGSST